MKDLEDGRKAYFKSVEQCTVIGVSYSDFLDIDIRTFNSLCDGFTYKRELYMNDIKTVGHMLAGKISQAVWGSKDFSKPIADIRLREQSDEERMQEKVLKFLQSKGLI